MKAFSYTMKKILKKYGILFALFTLPIFSIGQVQIPVNVVMIPPYPSNYSSYENLANHAVITLMAYSEDLPIVLQGTLRSGDFFIQTRGDYRGGLFTLRANTPKTITNEVASMQFLNRNNVTHGGISAEQWAKVLRTGELPEGQYEFCVQALWINPRNPSGPTLVGEGCVRFTITNAQAPQITSPFDGQELNPQIPNTVFSWTPPIGNIAGANLVYDLYVVKVPQGQNPNDAINGAVNYKAGNPIIKTNLTGTQYVTQPYDLKIDTSVLYAVQVIARDLNRQVGFKNNGRSEVVTFTKGKVQSKGVILTTITAPEKKPSKSSPGYTVTNVDPVPYSQLKGKLLYRFKDAINKNPSGKSQQTTPAQLKTQQEQAKVNANVLTGSNKENADNLVYNKDNTFVGDAKPLAGKKVSLVITYLFSGTINGKPSGEKAIVFQNNTPADADQVLATDITGPDGSFTFNFTNNLKVLGVVKEDFAQGSGEISDKYFGKLYKVLRIRVEDQYYCSPDVNIKIDPWKGIDLGNMVSFVKSYTLKVKVSTTSGTFWDMAYGQGSGIPKISTSIFRKGTIASVPADEGVQSNEMGVRGAPHYLGKGETDKDGFVTFKHLVMHNPDNNQDRYFISCTPDPKKGDFIFKAEEKRYTTHSNKELINFPFNSLRFYTPPKSSSTLFNVPIDYGSNIKWNSELEVQTYTFNVEVYPAKPRIAGKLNVKTNVEAKALSGKKVVMMSTYVNPDPSKFFTVTKTDSNGRYEFNNLPMELDSFKTGVVNSVIGPTRILVTKPDGFKAAELPGGASNVADSIWRIADSIAKVQGLTTKPVRNCSACYPPLKWGQQLLNQDFFLDPDGWLKGYVVDEKGNAIASNIDVDGYTTISTTREFTYSSNPGINNPSKGFAQMKIPTGSVETFSLAAPSGKRKITVTPNDPAYAVKDTLLTVPKNEANGAGIKFVVIRKQKRIRFKVAEAPEGQQGRRLRLPGSNYKAIPGATVTLNILPAIIQTADKDGYVMFTFDNQATSFDFTIEPPADANYETGTYTLNNVKDELQTVTYGNAYLKKAAVITGKVTSGAANTALEGATVYIDLGGGKKIETITDNNGNYTLKGVATSPSEKTVWASKPGAVPNIISQSKKLTVSSKDENKLDFNLINDNELVIENIFGFKADIQSKEKQSDGTWLVSGNLIDLTSNENFSLQNKNKNQSIPFANLKIKKSSDTKNGIPIGVPAENSFVTDLANIELVLQNSFEVIQRPVTGDRIQIKSSDSKGMVMGKIAIQKKTLKFNKGYLTLNDDPNEAMLLTDKPGSFENDLATIAVNPGAKKKYGLSDLNGKSLVYKVVGFDATADANESWIQDNSLTLKTVLHISALPGMNPSTLDINAGNLIVHPDGFEPLKGSSSLKFKLEKWEFEGNNWQLQQNNSSITIASGTMKTGSINVPLSNIELKPDHLKIGNYDVTNLSMANIIPVDVITKKPLFGFDKSAGQDQKGHYVFWLIGEGSEPGVIIKNLPGMKSTDAMKFQNVSLISNGEQVFFPGNQGNNLTFYSVMKVKPLGFESGDNFVNMTCGIDLGIPQLKETSGIIQFSKEAGKIKFMLYPLNVSLKGPGGVDFAANVQFKDNPQTLVDGRFTALGTIYDKEGIKLKAVLNRTTTAAFVKVDPENQILPLGDNNTSLADIRGSMDADMSTLTWKNFIFSGIMKGFTGMQGDTRKTFTVTGSINATGEKIEVKNIPSGFGDIGLTYDIANSRFTGNLQIDKQIGAMSMSGTANLLVDGGGWYFLAGGKLQLPGLGNISSGLLIGKYNSMPADVSATLMQFAYDKSVPPSFKNGISGFFFTGMKDLPLGIPNFSIDLGILSASMGASAGVDARLWMDFGSQGNEYGIGAMAFAYAYLSGSSITCTKLSAEVRAELGIKGSYATSSGAFTLQGCGSLSIGGSIEQCVPTLVAGCKACAGISVSKAVKLNILLDSKGNTDLSFGFGNCSGQSSLTGGW